MVTSENARVLPSVVLTAMHLPYLGIGTAIAIPGYGLKGSPSESGLGHVLSAALDAGVEYFDTAPTYASGELILGEALRSGARTPRICSKIEAREASSEKAMDVVDESLRRIGISRMDTLLLHSASAADMRDERISRTLEQCRRAGRCTKIGASTYGVEDALAALSQKWCEVVQVEFSILNPEVVRALGPSVPGQEIVVRSVLCKGLLTPAYCDIPNLPGQLRERLECAEAVAKSLSLSMVELAVGFALSQPKIDVVLVGCASTKELDEVLRAQKAAPLPAHIMERLDSLASPEEEWSHPERWK